MKVCGRLFPLVFLLFADGLRAASTYYVAKTGSDSNSCSAATNTVSPKATIAAGNACISSPGDHLRIHGDSDGLTSISNPWKEQITIGVSGSAGNIITIEPWPSTGIVFWSHVGTVADFASGTLINGNSRHYVRVTGMYFISVRYTFVFTIFDTNAAVDFSSTDTTVYNWELDNNNFKDCGPISTHDYAATPVTTAQFNIARARDFNIHDNVFTNCAGFGGYFQICYNFTVTNNICTGRRKHKPSWASFPHASIFAQTAQAGKMPPVEPGDPEKRSGYFTYTGNQALDPASNDAQFKAFWLDVESHHSTFTNNVVRGYTFGFMMEAGVSQCTLTGNLAYNGRDSTIGFTSAGFQTARVTAGEGTRYITWINNVSYNNNTGFSIRQAKNPTLKNNIAVNNTRAQVMTEVSCVTPVAGCFVINPIFKNNLWWKTSGTQGGTNINLWSCPSTNGCADTTVANKTFDSWVTASLETGAVFGNPLFANPDSAIFDFHIAPTSPGAATGLGGVDIGAYPQGPYSDGSGGGGTLPVTITLVQLNGTVFSAGATVNLTWQTNGAGTVKIRLSRDSGVDWETITNSAPNTASYSWMVTAPAGIHNRIEVRSIEDDSVFDQSDADFTILGKFLVLRH